MKERLDSRRLIAVSGVKGSGKNECSSMLQYCLSVPKIFRQYWLYKYFRKWIKKFADPLKKMLSVLLNVPFERFNQRTFKEDYSVCVPTLDLMLTGDYKISDSKFNKLVKQLDPELKNSNLTIRQLMQYFGTQIMQEYFGKRIWIYSTLRNSSKYTIISDLRFIEECKAVKERNGICIYVNRPGYGFGLHASELEMKELFEENQYDYVVENTGTLEDLFNEIKKLCNDDL